MYAIRRSLLLAVGSCCALAAHADTESDRFFLDKRLAPGMHEYPAQKALAAYEASLKLPLYSSIAGRKVDSTSAKSIAPLQWTALGPGNVGGRTRAIRFDPSTAGRIYAGGVAGGVWRSDDSGNTWTALGDAMANMAVTAILVHPSDPQILIAGTGEGNGNPDAVRGAGIFRSTNGGATWTLSTFTGGIAAVNDMVYRPGSAPTTVYAATNEGLYQSRNGGVSFSPIANFPGGCHQVVYRADADTILASCGTSATSTASVVVRSNNASAFPPFFTAAPMLGASGSGATQIIPNMGRTKLAIAPSNPQIVYALIACSPESPTSCASGTYIDGLLGVYQSTDGGSTWSARKTNTMNVGAMVNSDLMLTNPMLARRTICGYGSPNLFENSGTYANTIAVDPIDPTRVWVGGVDLWRSDNSGSSWGLASYWWFSRNDSRWVRADHHAIAFDPAFDGVANTTMLVAGDGGIFRTGNARAAPGTGGVMDGSNSICGNQNLSQIGWGRFSNYGVTQFNHGSVYPNGASYFGGTLDNSVVLGVDGSPNAWLSPYDVNSQPESTQTLAGGDAGFTAIDNTPGFESQYMSNRRISIRRSTTDGLAWSTRIDGIANPGCGLLINPFRMDPNNPARLYTSHNVLWRTSDRALNWTQASAALPGTSCTPTTNAQGERFSNYAVAPGNADLLVAGTSRGQLCRLTNATSSNASTAFANCSSPAGIAYVSDVAFGPGNATTVYATISTFGVGHVWKSIDAGVSWSNISGNLPDTPAHTVVVSPFAPDTLYVGTDIGVFVTLNGGTSWARENTGFANVITEHLVFNASGPTGQRLYAFTHGRGAFRAPVLPPVDVSIAVSNGQTGVNAESSVVYTITASNPSAFVARDVTVTDTFPATLTSCSWTCSAPGGSCNGSGSGDVNEVVNIGAGSAATFTASCTLPASATGTLTNSAALNYANDANAANDTATDSDAIAPRVDLVMTKNDGVTRVNPGGNSTYTVLLENPSPVTVSNILITDIVPPGLSCTWACFRTTGGTCPNAFGSGDINETVTIGPFSGTNAQLFYMLTCTVDANATGSISNTATATYGNDSNTANNSATDVNIVNPSADVSISKTDGATSVNAGGTVNYTIVATNPSAEAIVGVTIADTFPATLSGCSWTCAASPGSDCGSGGASGTGNINRSVSLAASGGNVSYAASCTLAANATGTLSNTATATYGNDPTPGNNSATDFSAIVARADVAITKSDSLTTVDAGGNVNYSVIATNHGTTTIDDVTVVDTFPPELEICSWSCGATVGSDCGAGGASGSGNIARTVSLAASGGSVSYNASCTLAPTAKGTLSNTATVAYANDPEPANDSATDTTLIVTQGDVSITKTDGLDTVNAGGTVTYTLVATNHSPNALGAVTVSDSFPAELDDCSWSCSASPGSDCGSGGTNGSGDISRVVSLATLGGSVSYTATCSLATDATGTLSNTATVTSPNDPVPANNSATDETTIVTRADVSISKTDGLSSVNAGDDVAYTIVVTNHGASAIDGVAVTDSFPADLDDCRWTCDASPASDCGLGGESGDGDINRAVSLAGSGGAITYTANCTLDADASGTLSNTATVGYANDPDPLNDAATDTTDVIARPDLSITKSNGQDGVVRGTSTSYTIVVRNPAAIAAPDVRVTDTFSAMLTGCTWTCSASGTGACATPSGSSDIDQLVTVAANGSVTFAATCTIAASAVGSVINTATLQAANDPNGANDSATDTDPVLGFDVFADGFE